MDALVAAAIVVAAAILIVAVASPAHAQEDASGIHAGCNRHATGGCGVNVDRNANTTVPPSTPKVPPDFCRKEEERLNKEYQHLLAIYENIDGQYKAALQSDPYSKLQTTVDLAAKRTEALKDIWKVRQEWDGIRRQCGLGELGGGGPAQPGAAGGGGGREDDDGGGGGGAGGAASGGPGGGNSPSTPARPGPTTIGWLIDAAALQAVPPGTPAVKGLGIAVARIRVAQQQLGTQLGGVARPPVLRDSLGVVPTPAAASRVVPGDAPPLTRTALDAVGLLEREVAYLTAYVTSLGRYRGAMAVHDTAAALRQADALVPLIDSAAAAADGAAAGQAETQRQFVAVMDNAGPGGGASTAGSAPAPAHAADGFVLSAALRDELTAGGLSTSDLADVQKELAAMTPEDRRAALVALRAQTAVDSAIRNRLTSTDPAATWPMPSDGPQLVAAAAVARAIHSSPLAAESIQMAGGDIAAAATPVTASGAGTMTATPTTAPPTGNAPPYSNHHGGWLGWLEGSWPTPQLWWTLPLIAVGALVGYGRWLKRKEGSVT